MPENLSLRETTASSLSEAAVDQGGNVLLRLIAPGWSQNGRYYPESVLKSSGLRAFREGTQTYLDHPSRSDEVDRPERSVRDLVGSLSENSYWDPSGPVGPGLYARASVREEYRPLVDELASDIGMSIRADGTGHHGQAEGRQGTIIDTIESADSVDYVTSPAAGGKVIQLLESVQNPQREVEPPDAKAALASYIESVRKAGHTELADKLQEARNIGQWLEARLHSMFTEIADHMYGDGRLTRDERVALSAAIGEALTAFTTRAEADAPAVFERDLFQEPEPAATEMSESTETETGNSDNGTNEASDTTPSETTPADDAGTAAPSAPIEAQESTSEEDDMTGTPGAGTAPTPLAEFRQQIHSELDQARHRAAMAEARERARAIISTQLAEATISPAAAHDVTVSVMADLPLSEQRELNEAALITRIQERVDQKILEATEVLSAAGLGTPRDVGYTDEPTTYVPSADHFVSRRAERYKRLGMSESAAKIAANGRG